MCLKLLCITSILFVDKTYFNTPYNYKNQIKIKKSLIGYKKKENMRFQYNIFPKSKGKTI